MIGTWRPIRPGYGTSTRLPGSYSSFLEPGSRSEVLLVNAPSGDYVVCAITKNQTDERYEPDNAGYILLRKISAAAWKHFEPKRPYSPAPGAEKLKP